LAPLAISSTASGSRIAGLLLIWQLEPETVTKTSLAMNTSMAWLSPWAGTCILTSCVTLLYSVTCSMTIPFSRYVDFTTRTLGSGASVVAAVVLPDVVLPAGIVAAVVLAAVVLPAVVLPAVVLPAVVLPAVVLATGVVT